MKLPKQFGGQGFGDMMGRMREAMEQAQNLEEELTARRIGIDKGVVKATFDGTGALLTLKIDPEAVQAEDVEMLEDLIISAVRDGFSQATEMREKRVKEIMPNVPGL